MNPDLPGWSYGPKVSVARAQCLCAWRSFPDIAAQIATGSIISADWEPLQTAALAGCHRAAAVLKVPETVCDAFFNSPVGIRAQYARSATHGEQADRNLIEALRPKLLCALVERTAVPQAWLQRSLNGREAKTWIVESESDQPDADDGIVFEPWERGSLAREGLRAPVGTLIEVKGAWLGPDGSEQLNPAKAHRSYTINRTGYV